jgi:hypothetical protein
MTMPPTDLVVGTEQPALSADGTGDDTAIRPASHVAVE